MRLAMIGLSLGVLVASWSPARADDGTVAEQTVDVMNRLWGTHPGLRANHAEGIVVEGGFTPSAAGPGLSTAALFAGPEVPVVARFSNSTGLPDLPDGDPRANPHGLGLRFQLADGSQVDVVTNSLAFFPVANGEQFLELLQAVAASGPDVAKPTPVERFMASHPAAPKAFASVRTPASFAQEVYNGVDAFVLVDAAGKRQPFRFRLDPVAGAAHLGKEEAARQPPDFLSEELRARLAEAPVQFRLLAQLAQPGDPTADPTQPWPAERELVDLGMITLTTPTVDNAAAAGELMLLPSNLVDGIEPSGDPLIDARVNAYAVSFSRRSP